MLTENKKFIIVYILLVAVTILNIFELRHNETSIVKAAILSDNPENGEYHLAADDPSIRQPGGYHYGRVQRLTLAGQKRINTENPNLDIEKCKEAYLAYYSRQSEEEVRNGLLMMHNCER